MKGRILFLNGTSSSGKSTLAKALRPRLEPSFCYYSSDMLADAGFRQMNADSRSAGRDAFFDGFHRSVAAFAEAGIDLLIEHIVEAQSWADDLNRLLAEFDVFWVGVHAPADELERREEARKNRQAGEAVFHLKTHQFCRYHIEVDSTKRLDEVADAIVAAWKQRCIVG